MTCGVGSSVGSGFSDRRGLGTFVGGGRNSVVTLSRNVDLVVSSLREIVSVNDSNVGRDVDGSNELGLDDDGLRDVGLDVVGSSVRRCVVRRRTAARAMDVSSSEDAATTVSGAPLSR